MQAETQTTAQSTERLRPHPETRFTPPQVAIDLESVTTHLRAEPLTGAAGHRQQTIYKDGGLTIALFLFDRFTSLPEHRAAGTVSIHVLRGHVKVTAEEQVHQLHAGQILVLAPGLRHSVAAEDESEMLVTVRLVDH